MSAAAAAAVGDHQKRIGSFNTSQTLSSAKNLAACTSCPFLTCHSDRRPTGDNHETTHDQASISRGRAENGHARGGSGRGRGRGRGALGRGARGRGRGVKEGARGLGKSGQDRGAADVRGCSDRDRGGRGRGASGRGGGSARGRGTRGRGGRGRGARRDRVRVIDGTDSENVRTGTRSSLPKDSSTAPGSTEARGGRARASAHRSGSRGAGSRVTVDHGARRSGALSRGTGTHVWKRRAATRGPGNRDGNDGSAESSRSERRDKMVPQTTAHSHNVRRANSGSHHRKLDLNNSQEYNASTNRASTCDSRGAARGGICGSARGTGRGGGRKGARGGGRGAVDGAVRGAVRGSSRSSGRGSGRDGTGAHHRDRGVSRAGGRVGARSRGRRVYRTVPRESRSVSKDVNKSRRTRSSNHQQHPDSDENEHKAYVSASHIRDKKKLRWSANYTRSSEQSGSVASSGATHQQPTLEQKRELHGGNRKYGGGCKPNKAMPMQSLASAVKRCGDQLDELIKNFAGVLNVDPTDAPTDALTDAPTDALPDVLTDTTTDVMAVSKSATLPDAQFNAPTEIKALFAGKKPVSRKMPGLSDNKRDISSGESKLPPPSKHTSAKLDDEVKTPESVSDTFSANEKKSKSRKSNNQVIFCLESTDVTGKENGNNVDVLPVFADSSFPRQGGPLSKVVKARLEVRPIATYTETHSRWEKHRFSPWKDTDHPVKLAYKFENGSFPSVLGKPRTSLPDKSLFKYKGTFYDPKVSVVELALQALGGRNARKPDVISDGIGQLTSILALSACTSHGVSKLNIKKMPRKAERRSTDADAPLRLFTDSASFFLDHAILGPRFEYIATQPDELGDTDLLRRRQPMPVQLYGGFRVILELTLIPEVGDAQEEATPPNTDSGGDGGGGGGIEGLEPLTIVVNTEIDACDRDDPTRWIELKAKNSPTLRERAWSVAWCQAKLSGCSDVLHMTSEKGRNLQYIKKELNACIPEDEGAQHLGFLYRALRSMQPLVKSGDCLKLGTRRCQPAEGVHCDCSGTGQV